MSTSRSGSSGDLAAARFDRTLDHGWRRTSYSDITSAAGEPHVASEPEEPIVADDVLHGGSGDDVIRRSIGHPGVTQGTCGDV